MSSEWWDDFISFVYIQKVGFLGQLFDSFFFWETFSCSLSKQKIP